MVYVVIIAIVVIGFIVLSKAGKSSFNDKFNSFVSSNGYVVQEDSMKLYKLLYHPNKKGVVMAHSSGFGQAELSTFSIPDVTVSGVSSFKFDFFVADDNAKAFQHITHKIVNNQVSFPVSKIPYEKIIKVEIIKQGHVVYSKSTSRTIGGALIGGALLGGAGAIVGGLSGDSTGEEITDDIKIKILLDDLSKPCIVYDELDMTEANGIKDLVDIVLNKINSEQKNQNSTIHEIDISKKVSEHVNSDSQTSNSVVDELLKLSSLLEKGLITEDEFKQQKMRLLA